MRARRPMRGRIRCLSRLPNRYLLPPICRGFAPVSSWQKPHIPSRDLCNMTHVQRMQRMRSISSGRLPSRSMMRNVVMGEQSSPSSLVTRL
jgi:hypothetical protein